MLTPDYHVSFLVLMQGQGTDLPLWLTMTQAWSEIVWRGATVLGIVAGGLFAYYKFLKGRTFAPRIEPTISGSVIRKDGTIYLQASATAKNTGLSKVNVDHSITSVRLFSRRAGEGNWSWLSTLDVFSAQEVLEPGQAVGIPFWYEVPEDNYLALRLYLVVARDARKQWWAMSIVNLMPDSDNEEEPKSAASQTRIVCILTKLEERITRWWDSRA